MKVVSAVMALVLEADEAAQLMTVERDRKKVRRKLKKVLKALRRLRPKGSR